jgi:5,10-methylenetetrahydromethanopterin reductase
VRDLASLAALAEQLGFSHVWVLDERFWRDFGVCLTAAVQATERVFVGSAVTDPYIRHPALTAQLFATLDELSGGRMICGMGAGIAGFHALGIRRERPVVAIREAVSLMRELWAGHAVERQDGLFPFSGSLDFKPPRSRIPVYVAGRGPRVLSLAGAMADGVMVGALASPPGLSYALDRVAIGAREAGRAGETIHKTLWLHTAIADDEEQAVEAVRTIVTGALVASSDVLERIGIPLSPELVSTMQGVSYGLGSPGMLAVRSLVDVDVVHHFAAAGSPDHVRHRVQDLFESGVEHVALLPWLVPGQTPGAFAEAAMDALEPLGWRHLHGPGPGAGGPAGSGEGPEYARRAGPGRHGRHRTQWGIPSGRDRSGARVDHRHQCHSGAQGGPGGAGGDPGDPGHPVPSAS